MSAEPLSRETWAHINDVFHRALEEPPDGRPAFLEHACAGDDRVRTEVESLLDAHGRAGEFIEAPTVTVAAMIDQPSVAPPVPDAIGPYRVLRLLGEGGMGVVYLAEDTRLGRTVALKALAPRFLGDPLRRERLRREARAAAALNHPGIATVYALEEIDDHLYIASEYVPGETLRDELGRGPLDPTRALDTMARIARAVSVAHERGIVHRDLKPENVMRTPAGELKILDFGLARFHDAAGPTKTLTSDGMILGTPAYMSPEQIRGLPIDPRSDVFSLGVILYELVTGANPFAGADPASTIAKILEVEPARLTDRMPPSAASPALGPIERAVMTCLRKSAEGRFRSAGELAGALDQARGVVQSSGQAIGSSAPVVTAPHPTALAQWWWQFHQAAATVGYSLLLIPLWLMREVSGNSWPGRFVFLVGLVGVVVASAMRLHLWFTARLDPAKGPPQHARSVRWTRVGDLLFAAALTVEGLFALSSQPAWGALLAAAAAAIVVSSLVIEPTTAHAAFGRSEKL